MTTDNELQKVKAFNFPKRGKYATQVIFFSIFFTWLGTTLGLLLSYKLWYSDINFNIILLLICGGTGIGFYIGNLFSKYSENNAALFFAMFSVSLMPLVFLQLSRFLYEIFKDNLNEDTTLLILGIPIIVGMPIVMYIILIKTVYCCENCKKSYESMTVFTSKIVSPYKVLSLLQNKQKFPNVSDLEEDKSFPRYKKDDIQIEVTANYCPHCYEAIINAELSYEVGIFGKEKRAILFYSDFWTGELFKKIFRIENNTIQNKEAEIVHHHKPSKLITSMECYWSKTKWLKTPLYPSLGLAGLYLAGVPFLSPPSLALMCFLILWFILFILNTFNNRPPVIINNIGIEYYKLKIGMVYWQDIERISLVVSQQKNEFICITLSKPEKYFNKLSKFKRIIFNPKNNRAQGRGDIAIPFGLLEPSANEVWEYISQLCENKHYIRNNANPNEYIKLESNG